MKKLLISLLVGFVGFVGFGYCDDVFISTSNSVGLGDEGTFNLTKGSCFSIDAGNSCSRGRSLFDNNDNQIYRAWGNLADNFNGFVCVNFDGYLKNTNGVGCTFHIYTPETNSCPEIDTNYCVENDLCPVASGSRSELVINNIVHEGRPLIYLNIPDYIQWDYTVDENQYDIYVGSGYDQDYIDSVLAINSYRPDSEDFTQIFVSGLTLIFPYIFVALLIVFMWKLLKRVFK